MDVPDICVQLGLVPEGASKQERARALAIARAPVPPGLRAIHPTWIEHALAGHIFTPENVLKKWHDFVSLLGAAE